MKRVLITQEDWFDVRILRVAEEVALTYENVREFMEECQRKMAGVKWVILNLGRVSHLDSSALSALIQIQMELHRRSGGLRLVAVSEKLRALFHITRLETLFVFCDSEEQARERFMGAG